MFPRSRIIPLHQTTRLAKRLAQTLSKHNLRRAAHTLWPSILALSLTSVAHAQGTMDFSGATTLMTTFNVGPSTIQSKIVFTYLSETIAKQPMCSFERQTAGFCDLHNHLKSWVLVRSRKIRQQILYRRFAAFVHSKRMFVG